MSTPDDAGCSAGSISPGRRPAVHRLLRRVLRHLLKGILLLGGATILFHIVIPPVYRFPPPRPFAGPFWYNPYASPSGRWLRANFHAHTRTWKSFINQEASAENLKSIYRGLGYDITGISNYQDIEPPGPADDLYIPGYEHGYGLNQQHQTVLGASSVAWLDYPLYQDLSQKQDVIDRLSADGVVVVLNHPNKNNAYPPEDLESLTGYTGIEVGSRFAAGLPQWEAALRAGRPVWGFCADDGHKLEWPAYLEVGWVMIDADERSPAAVVQSLKTGRFYSVWAKNMKHTIRLISCTIDGNRLSVACSDPVDFIFFISKNRLVKQVVNQATAFYDLQDQDPYVRVEFATWNTTLYLNPVFRQTEPQIPGRPPQGPRVEVVAAMTWTRRGAALLALLLLAIRLYGKPAGGRAAGAGA